MRDQPPELEQRRYISYLLRLWQTGNNRECAWRTSLESAHTGERRGFANLAELFAFLEKEVGRVAQRPTAGNRDRKGGDAHK